MTKKPFVPAVRDGVQPLEMTVAEYEVLQDVLALLYEIEPPDHIDADVFESLYDKVVNL
tara:strand:- start:1144 stop:1320 length:177 start_codon:yes stop_codon:yes gene_type:complete